MTKRELTLRKNAKQPIKGSWDQMGFGKPLEIWEQDKLGQVNLRDFDKRKAIVEYN